MAGARRHCLHATITAALAGDAWLGQRRCKGIGRAAGAQRLGKRIQPRLAALCQGAEIQLPLPPGGAEERMRELGRILRSAVDGTLRLMAVRASTFCVE